jgi:FKBP-type peptidyl-prolyl cis-trans isomerase (trigger factor)
MQQFAQMAQAQGVDLTTPEAQAEIRGQALDVLINTELLKQSASEEGITVSDEQAQERRDNIVSELGGEEALQARIQELGIPEGDLMSDIEEELLIQAYLDSIFAQSEISVSDEEVQEVYDQAGASGGELPPLEDVRPQVEQQIITTKEQEIIDQLLIDLKAEAEIETN